MIQITVGQVAGVIAAAVFVGQYYTSVWSFPKGKSQLDYGVRMHSLSYCLLF